MPFLYALTLGQMERDVLIKRLEEADTITDQDRQNGIIHFIGGSQAQELRREKTATTIYTNLSASPIARTASLR